MRYSLLFSAALMCVAGAATAQNPFLVTTTVEGNAYFPGEELALKTVIARTGDETINAFRFRITLPFGWSYVGDDLGQEALTQVTGLQVDHVWILPPVFPVTINWTVAAPETATGPAAFALRLSYRVDGGPEESQNAVATAMQSTVPPGLVELRQRLLREFDTADANGDGAITAAEALEFDEAYDADIFDALDTNDDGVVDELELSVNVLATLDCGCAETEDTETKGGLGDLLLLSALITSLAAMNFAAKK